MSNAALLAGNVPVPLEGVSVEAEVVDFCARVVIAQRYRNRESQPIEAVYVFPVEEGAGVCGFEAVVGATHVVGQVEEREKAFARYDDAMAAGHGAYLLDQEAPDVFTASIGNVPPGQEVLVRVTYVTELTVEDDELRFVVPTTVSPRYAPESDRTGVGRTPAEGLNPPRAFSVPYGLELKVDLDMPSALRAVESPSHPLSVEIDRNRATVRLGGRESALDRDFVLKVRLAEPHRPAARVETTPEGETVAAVSFAPSFTSEEGPAELVFVVDRSGSMDGTSIEEARNALQLCLRSLGPGTHFNVVGFGDRHQMVFTESQAYHDGTLAVANRHVAGLKADLGGTELLPAMEAVLGARVAPGRPRQVFVLTDGQVTNTEAVIACVARHAESARVFTFGIGAGASSHLVRGMARAGGGAAEFIAPGERIEAKVLRQLSRALAPALSDVRVDWGGLAVRQAPHRVPPVFAGGRLVVYGFLEDARPGEVTLRAVGPQGPLTFGVPVRPAEARKGTVVATLAARALVRDLEEGTSPLHRRGSQQERGQKDRVKDEIVRLAVRYGLASKHTSFVAVERRETPTEGQAQLRRVPIALTRGWGGLDAPSAPRAVAFMAAVPRAMAPRPAAPPPIVAGDAMDLAFEADMDEEIEASDAAPASLAESVRPLDRVVALQKADGHWNLDDALADALGVARNALRAGAPRPAEAAAWATACALAWLEKHAKAEEPEWRLLAKKARAWLAKNARKRADGRDWLDAAREAV